MVDVGRPGEFPVNGCLGHVIAVTGWANPPGDYRAQKCLETLSGSLEDRMPSQSRPLSCGAQRVLRICTGHQRATTLSLMCPQQRSSPRPGRARHTDLTCSVDRIDDGVEVGRHGVVVEMGMQEATFVPTTIAHGS